MPAYYADHYPTCRRSRVCTMCTSMYIRTCSSTGRDDRYACDAMGVDEIKARVDVNTKRILWNGCTS